MSDPCPCGPFRVRVPVPAEPAVIRRVVPSGIGATGPIGPSGATPTPYPINGAASFTAPHGLPFAPAVWILTADGEEVETDVRHAPGAVTVTFPQPFTGILYVR